jgi:hypothetical protein
MTAFEMVKAIISMSMWTPLIIIWFLFAGVVACLVSKVFGEILKEK